MLAESSIETTQGLIVPARTALTGMLLEEIEHWEHSLNTERMSGIRNVLAEASYYGVPIDKSAATEAFTELVCEKIEGLSGGLDSRITGALLGFVSLIDEIGVSLEEGSIQNVLYPLLETGVFPLLGKEIGGAGGRGAPSAVGAAPPKDQGGRVSDAELRPVVDLLHIAQRFNFNVDRWIEIASARESAGTGRSG